MPEDCWGITPAKVDYPFIPGGVTTGEEYASLHLADPTSSGRSPSSPVSLVITLGLTLTQTIISHADMVAARGDVLDPVSGGSTGGGTPNSDVRE